MCVCVCVRACVCVCVCVRVCVYVICGVKDLICDELDDAILWRLEHVVTFLPQKLDIYNMVVQISDQDIRFLRFPYPFCSLKVNFLRCAALLRAALMLTAKEVGQKILSVMVGEILYYY